MANEVNSSPHVYDLGNGFLTIDGSLVDEALKQDPNLEVKEYEPAEQGEPGAMRWVGYASPEGDVFVDEPEGEGFTEGEMYLKPVGMQTVLDESQPTPPQNANVESSGMAGRAAQVASTEEAKQPAEAKEPDDDIDTSWATKAMALQQASDENAKEVASDEEVKRVTGMDPLEIFQKLGYTIDDLNERVSKIESTLHGFITDYESMADEESFRGKWGPQYDEIKSLVGEGRDGLGELYGVVKKYRGNELFNEDNWMTRSLEEAKLELAKRNAEANAADSAQRAAEEEGNQAAAKNASVDKDIADAKADIARAEVDKKEAELRLQGAEEVYADDEDYASLLGADKSSKVVYG